MRWPDEHVRIAGALAVLTALVSLTGGLLAFSRFSGSEAEGARASNRQLVQELGLTDLALWPEASYCRHPALADRFAAWSDHPLAIDHFPAGSLVPPPVHLVPRSALTPSVAR